MSGKGCRRCRLLSPHHRRLGRWRSLLPLEPLRFRLTPGLQTNLRFALVLATAGHPETNPEQAQPILQELLTQTPLLTPAEVSLATINLKSVEQQIALTSEARNLHTSSSQAARTESASIKQRLDSAESENRRLRKELEDAEAKLEAISSIERSIRAQEQ